MCYCKNTNGANVLSVAFHAANKVWSYRFCEFANKVWLTDSSLTLLLNVSDRSVRLIYVKKILSDGIQCLQLNYIYFRILCIPLNNHLGSQINNWRNIAFAKEVVLWQNLPPAWGKLCHYRKYTGVDCAIDIWSVRKIQHKMSLIHYLIVNLKFEIITGHFLTMLQENTSLCSLLAVRSSGECCSLKDGSQQLVPYEHIFRTKENI